MDPILTIILIIISIIIIVYSFIGKKCKKVRWRDLDGGESIKSVTYIPNRADLSDIEDLDSNISIRDTDEMAKKDLAERMLDIDHNDYTKSVNGRRFTPQFIRSKFLVER
jgi:hypothetical protein